MKLLKKIFVVLCFSFLFLISNAHALTNFNNSDIGTISYYLNNYGTYEDLKNMILSHIDVDNFLTKDKYIIYIDKSNNDTANKYFNVYFYQFNDDVDMHFALNYVISSYYGLYFMTSSSSETFDFFTSVATFNNNYSDITFSGVIDSTRWTTSYDWYFIGSNRSSDTFHIAPIFSNVESLSYKRRTWSTEPFSFNNSDVIYSLDDDVPLSALKNPNFPFSITDIYSAPENPNKCLVSGQIGVTQNISSLTFRVTGVTNALDYPLEGYFDMSTKSFLNNPYYDWKTFVNVVVNDIQSDDEYDVTYDLEWINGTSSDYLRLNYKITAIDDIDTNIDVSFTLTSKDTSFDPFFKNQLLIFGCPPNNIFTNISYGYTDDTSGISYSSDSVLSNWLQDNSSTSINPLLNTDLIGTGPVDSILLLPLNIMQNLLNVLNSNTCQPLVLPLPYVNRNITLPCINTLYSQIDGLSTFLNWFSAIASAFILYEYFIRLYKWVDNLLTFRENNHFGGF